MWSDASSNTYPPLAHGNGSEARLRPTEQRYDEEEEIRLTTGDRNEVASGPVGFHSGFLDDDDQATTSTPLYRDEPSEAEQKREAASTEPSGSNSKDS